LIFDGGGGASEGAEIAGEDAVAKGGDFGGGRHQ
jgi:hypothetical protein